MGKNGESITKRKIETFRSEYQDSTFCELYEASVERGVSYEEALKKYSHMRDKESEGFYVDKMVHGMQTKKVYSFCLKLSGTFIESFKIFNSQVKA